MITVAQQTAKVTGAGTSAALTFPAPTAAGNGVVVLVTYGANVLSSVDDNGGNGAYAQAHSASFFGASLSAIYYFANPAALSAATVHFSSSTSYEAQAFEVVGSLSLVAHTGTSGNSSTPQPGALSSGSTADTITFTAVRKVGAAIAGPGGYTLGFADSNAGTAYKVRTTAGAENPQWSAADSTPYAVVGAMFASTVTIGPVFAPRADNLQWSDSFPVQAFPADVLTWLDAFHLPSVPPADAVTADTLAWADGPLHDMNLTDRLTWVGSNFLLLDMVGNVAQTLFWVDSFQADINLLAVGRYRR